MVTEERPIEPAPSTDPRARSILNLGKNHEKDKRIKSAVRSYSEVANGFPGTTEATEALKRIEALGEKLIANVLPSNIFTPKADPTRRHKQNPDFTSVDETLGAMGAATAAAASSGGGSGGGGNAPSAICGAPTRSTGVPCRNIVVGGGYCYLHR